MKIFALQTIVTTNNFYLGSISNLSLLFIDIFKAIGTEHNDNYTFFETENGKLIELE